MNKLAKYTYIAGFSSLLLIGGPLSSQSMTIDIFNFSTDGGAITDWINDRGGAATVIEDFEDVTKGWYDSLLTDVGTFSTTDNTEAGTGSSSYGAKTGEDGAYFEVRDYNADGRVNTTPEGGTNYLDSADISEFELDVDGNYSNLFFYITDPSDVEAWTSTKSSGAVATIDYPQTNGSIFFVGINAGAGEYIDSIKWSVALNDDLASTNDGFGLDGFSTVNPVPEPATMLLFGAGLAGLAGISRRKKQ